MTAGDTQILRNPGETSYTHYRPIIQAALKDTPVAFIFFGDLHQHCDALCKFGDDRTILRKIARCYPAVGAG